MAQGMIGNSFIEKSNNSTFLTFWAGTSINKAMHIINGNLKSSIKISYINCDRGFTSKGKIEEIKNHMVKNSIDIMGIAEVELSNTRFHYEDLYNIKGYSLVKPNSWGNLGRARIIVYYKKALEGRVRVMTEKMSPNQPDIWLEVKNNKGGLFEILMVYREFTGLDGLKTNEAQVTRLSDLLEKVNLNTKPKLIMGDVNLDWKDGELVGSGNELTEVMVRAMVLGGFTQLVKNFTRSRLVNGKVQNSTIDHIWTNITEKVEEVWTRQTACSDHCYITCSLKLEVESSKGITKIIRSFRNFNEYAFRADLAMRNWKTSKGDLEESVALMETNITEVLDQHAPMRRVKIRDITKCKLSKETLKVIADRDEALRICKLTRSKEDHEKFKRLKNRVVTQIRWERKQEMYKKCETQQGAWSIIKDMNNSISNRGPPTSLVHGGRTIRKHIEIANHMNSFFVNKVRNNQEMIRKQITPYKAVDHLKKCLPDNIKEFFLREINEKEMMETIESLPDSSGSGLDNISNKIIKIAKQTVCKPLCEIINLSIKTGTFPKKWKASKIICLLKRGNSSIDSNFRPISLLSKISLCLETIVHKQITEHFCTNNLFHDNQHGYLQNKGTTTALIAMYQEWVRAANEGKYTGVLQMDLMGAFDQLQHKTFLEKFEALGASKMTSKWMESYLTGRTQVVEIGNRLSSEEKLDTGIPQGSKLGPLAFNIFCIDMPECTKNSNMVVFADDSAASVTDTNPEVITEKLMEDATRIEEWITANNLLVSKDKTEFMLAASPQKRRTEEINNLKITVGGKVIEQTKCTKILGIVFDNNLKFKTYLNGTDKEGKQKGKNGLYSQLASRIWILKRISNCPPRVKRMIGAGIFMSKLLYCFPLFAGGLTKGEMKHLESLQVKAAKIITNKHRAPAREALQASGWLNIENLAKYHSLGLFYKIRLTQSCKTLAKEITGSRQPLSDKLPLYGHENLHGLLKTSFVYKSKEHWNSLPYEVRACPPKEFKKKLREHLLKVQAQEL